MPSESFRVYILGKFLEYQRAKGETATLTEFAKFLGVSQSLMSQWINKGVVPSPPKALLLASKYGQEVYDFIDIEKQDLDLIYINENWAELDPEGRTLIRECAEKYVVTMESPETRSDQLIELMMKWAADHGYTIEESKFSKGEKPDHQSKS